MMKSAHSDFKSLYDERVAFISAIYSRDSCPFCGGDIQRKGDQYRCVGCGMEMRVNNKD